MLTYLALVAMAWALYACIYKWQHAAKPRTIASWWRADLGSCNSECGRGGAIAIFFASCLFILTIISPFFLEFGDGSTYQVVNGKYEKIGLIALDIPGKSEFIHVSSWKKSERVDGFRVIAGDKIRTIIPTFTYNYSNDPEICAKTHQLGYDEQRRLFARFMIENRGQIKEFSEGVKDINNSAERREFIWKFRTLLKKNVQIPGIYFDVDSVEIYEY